MKLLFDIFPIVLFFLAYKFFDIYYATAFAMLASVAQVLFFRVKHQHYEKLHVISLLLILTLGGATLFFHNPWFIKWKPTGIYWLSAVIFLGSHYIGKKPIIQRMMEANVQLPSKVWRRLNCAWASYFLVMGFLNIYIAYFYTTNFWVNFKLFGGVGCMLLFVFLQALYLAKHAVVASSSRS
ncbi:MAG: septation protein A [Gammaproteobacteria bacterium]